MVEAYVQRSGHWCRSAEHPGQGRRRTYASTMRLPRVKARAVRQGAVCIAGGAVAGAAIATNTLILLPVIAGVAWIGIHHHRLPGRVNYAANAAAGPSSIRVDRTKHSSAKSPFWQVWADRLRPRRPTREKQLSTNTFTPRNPLIRSHVASMTS